MTLINEQKLIWMSRSTGIQVSVYFVILLVMVNLNALVDTVQHPSISYFDNEHLFVGGITALITTIIYAITIIYIRLLNSALLKVQTLEELLPICSYCKRIRKPDSDHARPESWQQLEVYISERTSSSFTHGICPTCLGDHFPKLYEEMQAKRQKKGAGEG